MNSYSLPAGISKQPYIFPDGRMDTQNAALYLGYSKGYLHNLRVTGEGPNFAKIRGKVFYRKEDLDEWVGAFGTSRSTRHIDMNC
jgi:hypothetical protein